MHIGRSIIGTDIPGSQHRGEVHVDANGTRTIGDSAPMQRDTIFRISSMTKPIIAVATMILVEECKLRLDEPVDRWLPELAERQVLRRLDGHLDGTEPAKRPITVRDLLTFRMGFGQMMAPPDAYPILQAANEQQIGMGLPSPSTMPAPVSGCAD
jgi:CubicO group peptidase (beta-lactamase class C family)